MDSARRDLLIINSDVQFSFRDTVEPVYRELVALLLRSKGDDELTQAHLRQAIQETEALQLAKLQNFLRCSLAQAVEINKRQVDPKAALIYPIILGDRIEVILKTPQSKKLLHYQTPIPNSEVDQILHNLRRELEQRYLSPSGLSLSQQVYDWLIRPAETKLAAAQVKTLGFGLDGALRNIPMASLYDGQRYLVETYAVAQGFGSQCDYSSECRRSLVGDSGFK